MNDKEAVDYINRYAAEPVSIRTDRRELAELGELRELVRQIHQLSKLSTEHADARGLAWRLGMIAGLTAARR